MVQRVLIVEDNIAEARYIAARLSSVGVTTDVAGSLSAAIQVLRHRSVDAVYLDLSLPDSLGVDTVTAVHREAAGIPIVVLSGSEDMVVAQNCVRAGADSFLLKTEAMTAATLHRELIYAVARNRRHEEVRDVLRRSLQAGLRGSAMLPHAAALEQSLDAIQEYLRDNYRDAADDVATILSRCGTLAALRELRNLTVAPRSAELEETAQELVQEDVLAATGVLEREELENRKGLIVIGYVFMTGVGVLMGYLLGHWT